MPNLLALSSTAFLIISFSAFLTSITNLVYLSVCYKSKALLRYLFISIFLVIHLFLLSVRHFSYVYMKSLQGTPSNSVWFLGEMFYSTASFLENGSSCSELPDIIFLAFRVLISGCSKVYLFSLPAHTFPMFFKICIID
jgi:hypothetical protein